MTGTKPDGPPMPDLGPDITEEGREKLARQGRRDLSEEEINRVLENLLTETEGVVVTEQDAESLTPDPINTEPLQDSIIRGSVLIATALVFGLVGLYGLWYGVIQNTPAIGAMGVLLLLFIVYRLLRIQAQL